MSSGRAGGGGGDRLSGTHFWSPRSGGGLPSTGQQKKGGGGYTKTFANEEEVSVFEDARSEIDEIKVSSRSGIFLTSLGRVGEDKSSETLSFFP